MMDKHFSLLHQPLIPSESRALRVLLSLSNNMSV